jgi:hypothetical protein
VKPSNASAPALALAILGMVSAASITAQEQLVAFRGPDQRWGYKRADERVVIPPRFEGAGEFRDGRAPVKDADGFAIIDDGGRIVERIAVDAVSSSGSRIPPPADACEWRSSPAFPSQGLECYVRQLQGSSAAVGGDITLSPPGRETAMSAVILKLPTGVVVVEEIGWEGFTRRVLLPGVSVEDAQRWRLKLHPDLPEKDGCAEVWTTGAVSGGAFIEQGAGC